MDGVVKVEGFIAKGEEMLQQGEKGVVEGRQDGK